jgi:hypothetical protein
MKFADVPEEGIASVFTIEEKAKQETSKKTGGEQTLKTEAMCSTET